MPEDDTELVKSEQGGRSWIPILDVAAKTSPAVYEIIDLYRDT